MVGWWRRGIIRGRLVSGLTATRADQFAGRVPRIVRTAVTPAGVMVSLKLHPGHSGIQVEGRLPELAAAAKAHAVRVDTSRRSRAHRIRLHVITRDVLTEPVQWADLHADRLSMWDPVHLGTVDDGRTWRFSLVERSLLVAGQPGAGKSNLLQLVVAHASLSSDAQIVCIDPSEVQLSAHRGRCLAYAGADIGDATAAVELVHDEMARRLAWMSTAGGRKLDRSMPWPLLVFAVDELSYHLTIAGTGQQRAVWGATVRDVVARGRAAGIITVIATQRPTNDVVPASLSGLFSVRAAGRVSSRADSDRVLGDGMARSGYDASTIGLASRGVMVATSDHDVAVRFRAAWLSDDQVREVARRAVHVPAAVADAAAA